MAVGGAATVVTAPAGLGSLVLRLRMDGFETIKVSLSRFGERIKDFRPFWREYLAPAIYRDIERNFETEGGYVGGWAPLSTRYAEWKQRHYPGKSILRRTDALFHSLRYDGNGVGPGGIFIADEQSFVFGTSVPHGDYQQRGTARMVKRPFLFLGQQMRSTWGRALHRFAIDQADEAGLRVATARARGVSSGLL